MSHVEARQFAAGLREPVYSGVLKALERVPPHRHPIVTLSSMSPWVKIDQFPGPAFAVWRETGAVFEIDEDGAVGEEPVA